MKRTFSLLMLTLLLTSMLTLTFSIQPAKSESRTIIVPDDYTTIQEAINSANSGDTVYVRSGTYYENVVLDKSVSLLGEDERTTIIDGNWTGNVISIVRAGEVVLSQFTVQNSALAAEGIWISSNHNLLVNNTIKDNYYGIYLRNACNNTLRNNSLINNKFNLAVDGDSLPQFIHDIDTSNSVNGKPVYYLMEQNNLVIDSSSFLSVGYLGLVNSANITVKGLSITQNLQGLLLANTTGFTVEDFNALQNSYGLYIFQCHNGLVCDSNIDWNYWDGISARYCSNVTLARNHMNGNTDGIHLEFQSNCVVEDNVLEDSFYVGIAVAQSNGNIVKNNSLTMTISNQDYGHGISLDSSSNNTVEENVITSMRWVAVIMEGSTSNMMLHNTIIANGIGMYLDASVGNMIYQNNVINNTVQVEDHNSINSWDDGYPSVGNYWSDYNGTDSNHDGIGDIPYVIDANNRDNYPLMSPYTHTHVVGDMNGDGKVGLDDLSLLALAYGSKVGGPNWNPLADIAPPWGIISLTDIVTMGAHYGQHNP